MIASDLEEIAWPASRLGDAISVLIRNTGIAKGRAESANPRIADLTGAGAGEWIERASGHLGCEAEPLETTFAELERQLAALGAALLRLPDSSFLAVVRGRARSLSVLAPDLSIRRIPIQRVCGILREPVESPRRVEVDLLLREAGVSEGRRTKAAAAILRDQLGSTRFGDCWHLRVPPGAETWRWLRQTNAPWNAAGLTAVHTLEYLLWILSWWVMGQSALQGRMDRSWMLAWALLLFTMIPFRLMTTWLQGLLAIGVGGLLK